MNEIDDFFSEQDKRMNIPDEDVEEYFRTRLAVTRRKNQYVIGFMTAGWLLHSPGCNRRPTEGRIDGLEVIRAAPHSLISSQ